MGPDISAIPSSHSRARRPIKCFGMGLADFPPSPHRALRLSGPWAFYGLGRNRDGCVQPCICLSLWFLLQRKR
ncbi:hypothetical protein K440DRAFT_618932 [Wilcoxina mikolae CBS 423.85]|nr:hypothetical protein K440DRAFT_618932 [Wilcoxina mikolae CBS 423.85]